MSICNFFSNHLYYTRIFNINNLVKRYFSDNLINNCSFNIDFLYNKFFHLLNDCDFFLYYWFLDNRFLDNVLSYNSFLFNHWYFLCDNKRHLNLNCLHFSLEYLHFLILNSISVSRNGNLTHNFIGNSFFYFYFDWFFLFDYSFDYSLNLYNFDNLLDLYNNLFNRNLNDFLYFSYDHKWHWNLNNL